MPTTKHILQCNADDSNYFSAKFKVYFNTMADYSLSPPKILLRMIDPGNNSNCARQVEVNHFSVITAVPQVNIVMSKTYLIIITNN